MFRFVAAEAVFTGAGSQSFGSSAVTGPKVRVLEDRALRPGLSPGHLTIVGDLVLGPGLLLAFDLSTVTGDINWVGFCSCPVSTGLCPEPTRGG